MLKKGKKKVSIYFSRNSKQGLQEILLETHLKQKLQTPSPHPPDTITSCLWKKCILSFAASVTSSHTEVDPGSLSYRQRGKM